MIDQSKMRSPLSFARDAQGRPYLRTGLVYGECEDHLFFDAPFGETRGYWESECRPKPQPQQTPPAPPLPPVMPALRGLVEEIVSPGTMALVALAWLVWPRKRGRFAS